MNMCQVNITDIICTVVVLDLPAGPVKAFDLDCFAVLDAATGGNYVYLHIRSTYTSILIMVKGTH